MRQVAAILIHCLIKESEWQLAGSTGIIAHDTSCPNSSLCLQRGMAVAPIPQTFTQPKVPSMWAQPGSYQPEADKPHFESELEINDFPQHARWKVALNFHPPCHYITLSSPCAGMQSSFLYSMWSPVGHQLSLTGVREHLLHLPVSAGAIAGNASMLNELLSINPAKQAFDAFCSVSHRRSRQNLQPGCSSLVLPETDATSLPHADHAPGDHCSDQ